MTTVYFIRHAEADASFHDQRTRPLTKKGLADRKLVTDFLLDKQIDAVFSSPYKRTIDTISGFLDYSGLEAELVEDFRERNGDSGLAWGNGDMMSDRKLADVKRQWSDFMYTFSDGECYGDVQRRNVTALSGVLVRNKNKSIVIGTHGISLALIVNYYNPAFGFDEFMEMVYITPWVVKMTFNGDDCAGIEKINLFA